MRTRAKSNKELKGKIMRNDGYDISYYAKSNKELKGILCVIVVVEDPACKIQQGIESYALLILLIIRNRAKSNKELKVARLSYTRTSAFCKIQQGIERGGGG